MRLPLLLWFLASVSIGYPQHTDTLRFRSAAFGTLRTAVVHLPEFHRYAGPDVCMPVILLLDGQHEWFVEPLLNDIRFLQYTHQVPQAIVVTVAHDDRVRECATDSISQPAMPLLDLLTRELPPLLEPYHPGEITVLVGHSFSASFALYAYLSAPDAFDAVIALSPLHQVDKSLPLVVDRLVNNDDQRVLLAVGGAERAKDGGHYAELTRAVREARPERSAGRMLVREYPSAGHTSLPIIAFPDLLATLFKPYSLRDSLARVDDNYRMTAPPAPIDLFMRELETSWGFLGDTLPWDLAEINGLLSRLESSGHADHVIALLKRATGAYPNYYGFHAWLGELLLARDPAAGRAALQRSLSMLDAYDRNDPGYDEVKAEIEELLK